MCETAPASYLAFNLGIERKPLVAWRSVQISLHKIDHGSCNLQHGTYHCARAVRELQ